MRHAAPAAPHPQIHDTQFHVTQSHDIEIHDTTEEVDAPCRDDW
ncbi:hypothetical protein [Streptomyces sp. BP-8]|uniref:Uncharacterized protein n=1 Tax=Streptomyces sirii TaxID=3127701 RepID=A0ABZ2QPF8_9ACTN